MTYLLTDTYTIRNIKLSVDKFMWKNYFEIVLPENEREELKQQIYKWLVVKFLIHRLREKCWTFPNLVMLKIHGWGPHRRKNAKECEDYYCWMYKIWREQVEKSYDKIAINVKG